MGRLPEAWLRELFERCDLVQVVSGYVDLHEKSGRMWGCCPFHHETKPSFSVNPKDGFYHCFGCGKHGTVVDFVMEMERLGFREACEFLASRTGLALPEDKAGAQETRQREAAERVRLINREAAAFYHQTLRSHAGTRGREYLKCRGIDGSLATKYGLGYAPAAWHHLRDHLVACGFTDADVQLAGLVHEKNGRRYDAFRDRVIFPIISPQSEVIGFGGRDLGDGLPKYLNSPATPAFNKSRSLYNMNTIKQLRHRGELESLILMEGYMDVIGAARFDVRNACATLGTALTAEQAKLIKRFSDRVYVSYDGDAAGVKAALRALDLLADAGLEVRVVWLVDDMDPDEYLEVHGREAYMKQLEQAEEPMSFRLHVARKRYDLNDIHQRQQYAREGAALLRAEKSPVIREQYTGRLARETGFDVAVIREEIALKPTLLSASSGVPPSEVKNACKAELQAENLVTAVLTDDPGLAGPLVLILKEEDFENPVNAAIFAYLRKNADRGTPVGHSELLEVLEDPAAIRHLELLVSSLRREIIADHLEALLTSSVTRLLLRRLDKEIAALNQQIAQSEDQETTMALRQRVLVLGRKQHEIRQKARRTTSGGRVT